MRNDLKKKAKLIADEAYGLTGMKAQQKQALATWLTTGCRESLKDDVVVNVPNFIFPVVEVVWVDGQRGNKSSYVDSAEASTEMSEVHGIDILQSKLDTCMPFQHPATSGKMQIPRSGYIANIALVVPSKTPLFYSHP